MLKNRDSRSEQRLDIMFASALELQSWDLASMFGTVGSADASRCLSLFSVSVDSVWCNYLKRSWKIIHTRQRQLTWHSTNRFTTPSSSSIILRIVVWSDESIGAMEISRTALNLPQLFKCSFSSRKKFQTNLRKTSSGARIDVIRSPLTILFSVRMNEAIQIKRSTVSSMIAK